MTALLAATPGFRRRILAAGEMRELGATSAELHSEAGANLGPWLPSIPTITTLISLVAIGL